MKNKSLDSENLITASKVLSRRKFLFTILLVAFLSGNILGWFLNILINNHSDEYYLHIVASKYFEKASGSGRTGDIMFSDCELSSPTASEKKNGIKYLGICRSRGGSESFNLSLALSESGSVMYYSAEGFENGQ